MMAQFGANEFAPVTINGTLVYPMVTLAVGVGDNIRVSWMSAASPRTQGVVLRLRRPTVRGAKGRGGVLRAGIGEAPTIKLWMDTSPEPPVIEIVKLADDAVLRIYNQWMSSSGRVDEMFNNYGIVIEELGPSSLLLRCSDGVGDVPTFDDLVVRIDVIRGTDRHL